MPTNLVRDEIANGWREGVIFLAHEASKLEDLAEYSTIDALRYDLLEDAREHYEAILHLEQAIGQHEDAFYKRTYASLEHHWSDNPKAWAVDDPVA